MAFLCKNFFEAGMLSLYRLPRAPALLSASKTALTSPGSRSRMRAMGKLEKSIASLEAENATSPVMDKAGEFAGRQGPISCAVADTQPASTHPRTTRNNLSCFMSEDDIHRIFEQLRRCVSIGEAKPSHNEERNGWQRYRNSGVKCAES